MHVVITVWNRHSIIQLPTTQTKSFPNTLYSFPSFRPSCGIKWFLSKLPKSLLNKIGYKIGLKHFICQSRCTSHIYIYIYCCCKFTKSVYLLHVTKEILFSHGIIQSRYTVTSNRTTLHIQYSILTWTYQIPYQITHTYIYI